MTFGTPNVMAPGTGFGLGSTITTTTPPAVSVPNFNLPSGTVQASTTPGLSFDASKPGTTTPATTGFALATTTAGGFSFGGGTTTTTTGFPLSKTTSTTISTSLTAPSIHTSLGTTTM